MHAVARSLTAADFTPAQVDAFTDCPPAGRRAGRARHVRPVPRGIHVFEREVSPASRRRRISASRSAARTGRPSSPNGGRFQPARFRRGPPRATRSGSDPGRDGGTLAAPCSTVERDGGTRPGPPAPRLGAGETAAPCSTAPTAAPTVERSPCSTVERFPAASAAPNNSHCRSAESTSTTVAGRKPSPGSTSITNTPAASPLTIRRAGSRTRHRVTSTRPARRPRPRSTAGAPGPCTGAPVHRRPRP